MLGVTTFFGVLEVTVCRTCSVKPWWCRADQPLIAEGETKCVAIAKW
jgi:hypothetical protein